MKICAFVPIAIVPIARPRRYACMLCLLQKAHAASASRRNTWVVQRLTNQAVKLSYLGERWGVVFINKAASIDRRPIWPTNGSPSTSVENLQDSPLGITAVAVATVGEPQSPFLPYSGYLITLAIELQSLPAGRGCLS